MNDENLGRILDQALRPKREPIFGPNAGPVAAQFVVGLVVCYVVTWLLWKPAYDLMGVLIAPLFR
jgi:hypothetical protein